MDRGSLPWKTSTGSMFLIGNRARYRMEKTSITCFTTLALTMISPVSARPSKPTYDRWIARSRLGGTGQPGRQLKGTSPGASGPDTVAENGGNSSFVGIGLGLGVARGDRPGPSLADGGFVADAAAGWRAVVPAQPAASRTAVPTTPIDIARRLITSHRVRRCSSHPEAVSRRAFAATARQ